MIAVGIIGYFETPQGLRALTTVWAQHLSSEIRRRFYRNWSRSKKLAFTRYAALYDPKKKSKTIDRALERIRRRCTVVRLLVHTQIRKLKMRQKKAHVMEIQINGGTIPDKVAFGVGLFEKPIPLSSVFEENEMIDTIGISKGKGFEGVTTRWGTTRLPRKTHKGLRKVACIGAWHPSRVQWSVPRAGQNGYHHRTEINKKIYRIGHGSDKSSGSTPVDLTEKSITPMGGFPHYGIVNEDFLMIKGSVVGVRKRVITLRKSLIPQTSRTSLEKISLKFIDTSSKFGHGRFQTKDEKDKFFGKLKARPDAKKKSFKKKPKSADSKAKDKSKDKPKDKSKDKPKDKSKDKPKDKSKDKPKEKAQDKSKSKDKPKEKAKAKAGAK
jgi:large subunit ribosomal protein L3e